MTKQLKSISVFQTSKVVAVLYALLGLVYTAIGIIMLIFSEDKTKGAGIFLFMPVIMAVFGFIFVSLGCWLYNQVAKRFGGVEFILEDVSS